MKSRTPLGGGLGSEESGEKTIGRGSQGSSATSRATAGGSTGFSSIISTFYRQKREGAGRGGGWPEASQLEQEARPLAFHGVLLIILVGPLCATGNSFSLKSLLRGCD